MNGDGCSLVPGDTDGDGDVDQEDFGRFQVCLSGQDVAVTGSCVDVDLDNDSDVDGIDFGKFMNCMTGAGVIGNLTCAQ